MNNFNNNMMSGNFNNQRNQFSSYFSPATGVNTSTNNIIWVQGMEGAKAWQLSPNSMVILLDSEAEGKMYIKVSDNIGMCSLRVFNYIEEMAPNNNSSNETVNQDLDLSQYVKKDELSSLIKEALNEYTISTVAESDSATTTTESKPVESTEQPKVIFLKK